MGLVELHHLLLHLAGVAGGEVEVADVVSAVLVGVVVAQLRLQGVGAQERVRHERARQAARRDVLTQLQAQQVPEEEERGRERMERMRYML